MMNLNPPLLLRSPHVQTLLASRLPRQIDDTGCELLERAETVILRCRDGVRLQAVVSADHPGAPLVIILHGWLGRADAPYMRRVSEALYRGGFNVARLLLRDHGGTAGLNEELFNAARIDEVVDACNALVGRYGQGDAGLMGFSLGGNFALRVAMHAQRSAGFSTCLAICPVLDPETSAAAIDEGWFAYRLYFVRKFAKSFAEKQAAFPDRYEFSAVRGMDSIGALTDYLVERYTPFATASEYYSHYTLTADKLARIEMDVRVLSAFDDPVIPSATLEPFRVLPAGSFDLSPVGGHCGFIENYRLRSALGSYAARYFERLL
jgi:predicted alpha/beta-fold hydrolase